MISSVQKSFERWLAAAARETIERERPFVVAMTGSVGKSSTRQMIAALLQTEEAGNSVRASAKNYNNELGLPLTIFNSSAPGRSPGVWFSLLLKAFFTSRGCTKTGVRTFVLEMGADKPGDLDYLTSIAPPDIGIVTAVTPEDASLPPVHLAKYPSLQALAEEKSTVARKTKSSGTVILNADDPRVFAMRHLTQAHVITYGEMDAADVRLVETRIKVEEKSGELVPVGLEVKLHIFHRYQTYFIPGVFGRGLAYALAAALAVGEAMDVSKDMRETLLMRFKPLPGRARIIAGKNNVTFFDDSYNASPAAMLTGLRDLAATPIKPGQRRIAVIGEMREIGSEAEATHRRMGAEAAKLGLDLFVPCGTFAPVMKESAIANGMKAEQVIVCDDTLDAIPVLEKHLRSGDIVFAKASEGRIDSKGVRMERVVKHFMAESERALELLCRQEEAWKRK